MRRKPNDAPIVFLLLGVAMVVSPAARGALLAGLGLDGVKPAAVLAAAVQGARKAANTDLSIAARPPGRPRAERGTRPDGGRAARAPAPPAGLSFTSGAGCNPAADWRSNQLDLRVRRVIRSAAKGRRIRVSCLRSGHSHYVKGTTRVSNHTVWRGVDIDRVAGRPVTPGNQAARELALELGVGRHGARPSEVGSPWDFGRRPYFTDEAHQGHLHVGFAGPTQPGGQP